MRSMKESSDLENIGPPSFLDQANLDSSLTNVEEIIDCPAENQKVTKTTPKQKRHEIKNRFITTFPSYVAMLRPNKQNISNLFADITLTLSNYLQQNHHRERSPKMVKRIRLSKNADLWKKTDSKLEPWPKVISKKYPKIKIPNHLNHLKAKMLVIQVRTLKITSNMVKLKSLNRLQGWKVVFQLSEVNCQRQKVSIKIKCLFSFKENLFINHFIWIFFKGTSNIKSAGATSPELPANLQRQNTFTKDEPSGIPVRKNSFKNSSKQNVSDNMQFKSGIPSRIKEPSPKGSKLNGSRDKSPEISKNRWSVSENNLNSSSNMRATSSTSLNSPSNYTTTKVSPSASQSALPVRRESAGRGTFGYKK